MLYIFTGPATITVCKKPNGHLCIKISVTQLYNHISTIYARYQSFAIKANLIGQCTNCTALSVDR